MPRPKIKEDHWLARPQTIRILWISFVVILASTVIADFFVHHDARFGIEGTFGFYAWYGFLSCVVLIFISRALGVFLRRPDDYYDR